MLIGMTKEQKKMIDHISRLEGQLGSVKSALMEDKPDCVKASKTLLSASRSFAGLREQFVESFLLTHFIEEDKLKDRPMFEQLIALIKG